MTRLFGLYRMYNPGSAPLQMAISLLLLTLVAGCDAIVSTADDPNVAELAKTWRPYKAPNAVPPLMPQVGSPSRPAAQGTMVENGLLPYNPALEVQPAVRPIQEWTLTETAIHSLGRIGAAAVPGLEDALRHEDPKRRYQAASVLARIGPEAREAVPSLVTALQDPEPEVQKAAAHALGQIGPDAADAVQPLLEIMNGDTP